MRTRLERKIDHIISMIDRQSNKKINNNYKVIEKIVSEISNFEDLEKSVFFMKLFSESHNDEIVFLIIDFFIKSGEFLFLKYNDEISGQYNDKTMFQLAIENNYSAKTIMKFYEMNRCYNMRKNDNNGFTILHTLVSSDNPDKYLIYKNLIEDLRFIEEVKDNNNNTYIDLAKKIINENYSNLSQLELVAKRAIFYDYFHLKNIICDYYYCHFDEFLDMLTEDVEQNKKLILDNLIFKDYTINEEKEKYDVSKLLFRCIDSNKEFNNRHYIYKKDDNKVTSFIRDHYIYKKDDNELLSIIKKLLETKYPKITSKDNFISFVIEEGYSVDFVLKIFEMLDELGEEIPDWLYYEVLKTYINILLEGKFIDLYDYFCDRGFNLLKVNIDGELLKKYENRINCPIRFYGDATYYAFLKKMVIEMHNALVIKKINQELLFCGYDKVINSCRSFSGKRLLEYDIDAVIAEEIASKIIENRKDAIYVSDEITKEEVISAIEDCKSKPFVLIHKYSSN